MTFWGYNYPNKDDNSPLGGEFARLIEGDPVITSRQIRAGRALLGWSQQELADKAIVSLNAVRRLEGDTVDPRVSTIAAVEKALVGAGVSFLAGDGVQLAQGSIEHRPKK